MQKYVIGVSDQNRHKQRRWHEVEGLHNLRRENKEAYQLRKVHRLITTIIHAQTPVLEREYFLYQQNCCCIIILSLSLSLSLSRYTNHEHKQNFKDQVSNIFFYIWSRWVLVKTASIRLKRVTHNLCFMLFMHLFSFRYCLTSR